MLFFQTPESSARVLKAIDLQLGDLNWNFKHLTFDDLISDILFQAQFFLFINESFLIKEIIFIYSSNAFTQSEWLFDYYLQCLYILHVESPLPVAYDPHNCKFAFFCNFK